MLQAGFFSTLIREMARIGCILINYRYPEDTLACLHSLRESGAGTFKIFLVNNHGGDGSGIPLRNYLSGSGMDFQYLEPRDNLGFAGGCNLGIEAALSETALSHILILNNDVLVGKDFASEAERAVLAHPSKIVAGTVIDSVTGTPSFNIGRFTPMTGQIRHLFEEGFQEDLDFVSGCLMLVPADVFRRVGLFAESYFMYSEDADFCMRAKAQGVRIQHWPALRLSHALSSATSKSGTPKEYYRIRNQSHLIFHRGRSHQKGLYLFYLAALLFQRLLFRPADFRQSWRGAADAIAGRLGKRHPESGARDG